ncbi:hypothetical protein BH10BAC1_BH10BAC1_09620 [soil metagenome]
MENYIPNFTNRNKYVRHSLTSIRKAGVLTKTIWIALSIIFIFFLAYTFSK